MLDHLMTPDYRGILIIETEGTYRNWSTFAMGVFTGRELRIGTNIHRGALIRKGRLLEGGH